MKNRYARLKKKLKLIWKKEYILWAIVIIWTSLFWEGHRFLPGAKWLSAVIPVWIVILNLAFLFIFTTLLINKTSFPPIGVIATLIGVLLSWILLRVGYKRFPVISLVTVCLVIFVNLALKIWRDKEGHLLSK